MPVGGILELVSDTREIEQDSTGAAPETDATAAAAAEVHPLLRAKPSRRQTTNGPRIRHRKSLITVVVLGAIICLLMGYWQLSRWNSSQGTYMNLGYSIEWPFFAFFLVFLYRRLTKLEDERARALEAGHSIHDRFTAAPDSGRRADGVQTEIPRDFLPTRTRVESAATQDALDPALTEYNNYLASLDTESATTAHAPTRSPSTPAEGSTR